MKGWNQVETAAKKLQMLNKQTKLSVVLSAETQIKQWPMKEKYSQLHTKLLVETPERKNRN